MSNNRSGLLAFLAVIGILMLAAVLVGQYYLKGQLERLRRVEQRIAEKVDSIAFLENRNEDYRALRQVGPDKRPVLYPAKSTFRPAQDRLEDFQPRLRQDLIRWTGLDTLLLQRKIQRKTISKRNLDTSDVVLEEVEVSFEGNDMWSLHGYLLYPDSFEGHLPGVVCLNGHKGTARAVAGLESDYTHGYGRALAEQGYKVFTFDWCFEGESRLEDSNHRSYKGHDSVYDYMAQTGRTGLALYMENAYCAFKALKEDPDTDPERVGVTGISRGGELTTYFSALFAPQIRAYYASGAGFPFVYRRFGGGCKCTYVEKIFENYEFSDLLVAAAPLPGKIQLGVRDNILGYWDYIEQLLAVAKPLYGNLGAPDKFGLDIHGLKHEYLANQAVEFFNKYLKKPQA